MVPLGGRRTAAQVAPDPAQLLEPLGDALRRLAPRRLGSELAEDPLA
jgi:hypothetical protein